MTTLKTSRLDMPRPTTGEPRPVAALPAMRSRIRLIAAGRLVDLLFDWQERRRQRRVLAAMDDYMLRDIGLSVADVHQETHKPFWRP